MRRADPGQATLDKLVTGGALQGNTGGLQGNIALASGTGLVFDQASNGTFSGTISGTGAVTKQNTGTLTILTNNTYTGGTTITGGTLNIGNGGTTGDIGSGPLTVTAGSVVWNRSDDINFASAITNNGAISKPGTNNMNLTGSLTGSGTLALGGGTLSLNASSDYTYSGVISGPAAAVPTATLGKRTSSADALPVDSSRKTIARKRAMPHTNRNGGNHPS